MGYHFDHAVRNSILNGSESLPIFKQNQILATNLYGFPEIDGIHGQEQDLTGTNPLYSSGDSCYTYNCQRCVVAYEARRRGLDVHAKPYLFQLADTLPYDDEKIGWPSVFRNSKIEYCDAKDVSDVKNNIHNKMVSWGDGARAIVSAGYLCGGGHVFVAEYRSGIVHYIDPQNAEGNVEYYFNVVDPTTVSILRMDNCEFTDRIRECCEGAIND